MASQMEFSEKTQTECSATWVAKEPPPNYVVDPLCSICTILREHIPSEPLSYKRLAGGPLEAVIGETRLLSTLSG